MHRHTVQVYTYVYYYESISTFHSMFYFREFVVLSWELSSLLYYIFFFLYFLTRNSWKWAVLIHWIFCWAIRRSRQPEFVSFWQSLTNYIISPIKSEYKHHYYSMMMDGMVSYASAGNVVLFPVDVVVARMRCAPLAWVGSISIMVTWVPPPIASFFLFVARRNMLIVSFLKIKQSRRHTLSL